MSRDFRIESINVSPLFAISASPCVYESEPLQVDLLATVQIKPVEDAGLFGFVKGGIAYRQQQVDRNEVNDLTKISPELQAGLGFKINENMTINATS